MKKIVSIIVCLSLVIVLSGCGDTCNVGGIEYDTYGLLNESSKKNERIEYEVSWGNVIWGALLFETIIGPIYFFGFALFEPVGPKAKIKGQVLCEK